MVSTRSRARAAIALAAAHAATRRGASTRSGARRAAARTNAANAAATAAGLVLPSLSSRRRGRAAPPPPPRIPASSRRRSRNPASGGSGGGGVIRRAPPASAVPASARRRGRAAPAAPPPPDAAAQGDGAPQQRERRQRQRRVYPPRLVRAPRGAPTQWAPMHEDTEHCIVVRELMGNQLIGVDPMPPEEPERLAAAVDIQQGQLGARFFEYARGQTGSTTVSWGAEINGMMETLFVNHTPHEIVVTIIKCMRWGDALSTPPGSTLEDSYPFDIRAYSIHEIKAMVVEAGRDPKEFYLTCQCYEIEAVQYGARLEGIENRNNRAIDKSINSLCLGDVEIADPTLLALDNTSNFASFQSVVDAVKDQLLVTNAGSTLAAHYIIGNFTLSRRMPFPGEPEPAFRTASFERLVPYDIILNSTWKHHAHFTHSIFAPPVVLPLQVYIPGGARERMYPFEFMGEEPDSELLPQSNCIFDVIFHACDSTTIFSEYNSGHHLYNTFFQDWLQQRIVKKKGADTVPNTPQYYKIVRSLKKNWLNMTCCGLSPELVRRVVLWFYEKFRVGVDIRGLDAQQDEGVLVPPRVDKLKSIGVYQAISPSSPAFNHEDLIHRVLVLQVTRAGDLAKCARKSVSNCPGDNLLHAVGITPYPWDMGGFTSTTPLDLKSGLARCLELLKRAVELALLKTQPFSIGLFTNADEMKALCDIQLKRCERQQRAIVKKVSADIHHSQPRESHPTTPVPSSSSSSSSSVSQPYHGGSYGLMVYDMETVDNVRGLQHKVWEPFRTTFTPHAADCFTSESDRALFEKIQRQMFSLLETQIPYCVQWGLINKAFDPNKSMDSTPIYRDSARIEWGGNLLGKCVDDFFTNAAVLCSSFQIKIVYCYAHNGARFDALLMKTFIHSHKIKDILITPRGILSMKVIVKVPHRPGSTVTFILRDTMAFFGQSLSLLCKTFGVPDRFAKTDFPITKVNMRNYDDKYLREMLMPYVRNDVYSLSFIVLAIDKILGSVVADFEAPHPMSVEGCAESNGNYCYRVAFKPPIARFMTLMSVVKFQQKHLFYDQKILHSLCALDLPALRNILNYANVGGRVQAFWRSYVSKFARPLLEDFVLYGNSPSPNRRALYDQLSCGMNYLIVQDVTSLYPYVMATYPQPTGTFRYLTPDEAETILAELDCARCIEGGRICSAHASGGELDLCRIGFAVIGVEELTPPPKESDNLLNICPRKVVDLNGPSGLLYSHETDEQYNHRCPGKNIPACQMYTMYDLLWFRKCGWSFKIVHGGIVFQCSYVFQKFINDLYLRRNEAKEREKRENLPKCESTFWKNDYNGHYGVECQKDIHERHIIADEPTSQVYMENGEDMEEEDHGDDGNVKESFEKKLRAKRVTPDEEIVRNTHTHKMNNGQWLIRLKKSKYAFSEYAQQSPNQIGACVTSTARHHMNLILWKHYRQCGYTDTDSLGNLANLVQELTDNPAYAGTVDESTTPALGSYKNDHESPGAKVFMSFFLGKKIKLHWVIDSNMNIEPHATFKGYNPSRLNNVGDELRSEVLQYMRVSALGEIFYRGSVGGLVQTEFQRQISRGVIIDRNSAFSTSLEASYGHHDGVVFDRLENGDLIERLIPRGKTNYTGKLPFNSSETFYPFYDVDTPTLVNRSSDRIMRFISESGIDYNLWTQVVARIIKPWSEGNILRPHEIITPEAEEWANKFRTSGISELLPTDLIWPE